MKNLKKFNKISLLAFGATSLALGNITQTDAQVIQAQTMHNLNLRAGCGTNNCVILTLKKGTTVEIIESLGIWSKVRYKNHIGYVANQYLENLVYQDSLLKIEDKDQCHKVKEMECGVKLLNIRFGPSASEKGVGTLKKGDKVEVLYEVNNTWARIKYNGGHGYVSIKYLDEINQNNMTDKSNTMNQNTHYMKCKENLLNVRTGPSSFENIIGKLEEDDIVEVVYHISTGWTKIKYANNFAYVNTESLVEI